MNELEEKIKAEYWRNPNPNQVLLRRLWAEFDWLVKNG